MRRGAVHFGFPSSAVLRGVFSPTGPQVLLARRAALLLLVLAVRADLLARGDQRRVALPGLEGAPTLRASGIWIVQCYCAWSGKSKRRTRTLWERSSIRILLVIFFFPQNLRDCPRALAPGLPARLPLRGAELPADRAGADARARRARARQAGLHGPPPQAVSDGRAILRRGLLVRLRVCARHCRDVHTDCV